MANWLKYALIFGVAFGTVFALVWTLWRRSTQNHQELIIK